MAMYRTLRDPNAEYTMRDLSSETMGLRKDRGPRDVEITDIQTTMVDGNYPWILVRVYTDAAVLPSQDRNFAVSRSDDTRRWR